MKLTDFISGLINDGSVTVAPKIIPFSADDLKQATIHLQQYQEDDTADMPYSAPEPDLAAALWAAEYLYRTVQFILIRNLDENALHNCIQPYTGNMTPAAAYSADLTLRYLPDLLNLAKGLSPDDPLVKQMRATAATWPLSAAAINDMPAGENLSVILSHPSLRQAYVDRIIYAGNKEKCSHPDCLPLVREALGAHTATLWPQFEPLLNDLNYGTNHINGSPADRQAE